MREAALEEFCGLRSQGIQEDSEVGQVLHEHRKVALVCLQHDNLDKEVSHEAGLEVETLLQNRDEATSVLWVKLDVDESL